MATTRRRRNTPVDPVDEFFRRIQVAIAHNLEGYLDEITQRMEENGFEPVQVSGGIPPEMFKKLMLLCHPDKHGNSETSQEVTRWLLEQRK